MKVIFEPEIFIPKYIPLLTTKKRHLALWGGRARGGSYFAAEWIVANALFHDNTLFPVVRKTKESHKHTTFREITSFIQSIPVSGGTLEEKEGKRKLFRSLFNIPSTPKSGLDIYLKNGSVIAFFGLHNPDDKEKFKGIKNAKKCWIEESSEINETEYEFVEGSIRGPKGSTGYQILQTFNPINSYLWQRGFIERPDVYAIHGTMYDNPYIDEEYIESREKYKENNPDYYKVMVMGEWGELGGVIFPELHIVDKMPGKGVKLFGIDFGYEHPTVITENILDENRLYIKTRLFARHMTNQDLIEFINKEFTRSEKQEFWVADSAEPARIEDIYRQGVNIRPAMKDVEDGIDCLKSFKLHLCSDSPEAITQFQLYSRQRDKEGRYLDKPVKVEDDAPDSSRYAVYTYWQKVANKRVAGPII